LLSAMVTWTVVSVPLASPDQPRNLHPLLALALMLTMTLLA